VNLGLRNFYKLGGDERLQMARLALFAGLLLAALASGTPASAQGAGAPDFAASLRQWMSDHQVPAASIAIMKGGRLMSTSGFGGMNAAMPARIASLSKSITGVCVAQLVDAGRLSFTATLGSVLGRTFARLGQPIDTRFKAITIEQLLMHRAGLAREPLPVIRARDMNERFINSLATPLNDDPGAAMVYSNIGYHTLGMVVEAVTGRDYERYCRDAALAPMKASGTIDPQLRHRASSGGWRISAIDYARFIQVFEPGSAGLGPQARKWQDERNGPRAYGLGIAIRRTEQGVFLTHTGRVPLRERGGAFVIKYPTGWTAVVTFAGDPRAPGTADLRRRLAAAVASF
jgi:CubicO group peptidase (beta-lactamase class C family)